MARFNYCIPLKGGKGKVTFKGSGAKGGSAKDAKARGVLCSKTELKSGNLIRDQGTLSEREHASESDKEGTSKEGTSKEEGTPDF